MRVQTAKITPLSGQVAIPPWLTFFSLFISIVTAVSCITYFQRVKFAARFRAQLDTYMSMMFEQVFNRRRMISILRSATFNFNGLFIAGELSRWKGTAIVRYFINRELYNTPRLESCSRILANIQAPLLNIVLPVLFPCHRSISLKRE